MEIRPLSPMIHLSWDINNWATQHLCSLAVSAPQKCAIVRLTALVRKPNLSLFLHEEEIRRTQKFNILTKVAYSITDVDVDYLTAVCFICCLVFVFFSCRGLSSFDATTNEMNVKLPKMPQFKGKRNVFVFSFCNAPSLTPNKIPIFMIDFLTFNLHSTLCNWILEVTYVINGACSEHSTAWKWVTTWHNAF